MSYGKAKVYFDGSHYIAIPKELQHSKRVRPVRKEIIDSQKEKFDELYNDVKSKKKKEKIEYISKNLKSVFEDVEKLDNFIDKNMERKTRNLIERKKRLTRKINLNTWNYFCTFTYDSKLHTEESFKKTLSTCFRHLVHRKNWKYIGVWERSPENNRLHFHGLFYIPNMVGELQEIKDYSTKNKKMQTTNVNSYFLKRFGRNDFSKINKFLISRTTGYLLKYIEKSGEKIISSKNVYSYIVSDIMDDDIACPYGVGDRKIILFDDFKCFDEGELIGNVSPEVIEKMPKCN